MALADYTLFEHIGWLTSRQVPLSSAAISELITIVNNSFPSYIPKFAGITSANSCAYKYRLDEIYVEDGFETAASILIPNNFLNFIEFGYLSLTEPLSFTQTMITQLFNCLEMTNEFAPYLTALQGITPENCLDWQYKSIIQTELMLFPKFIIDAETFPVPT